MHAHVTITLHLSEGITCLHNQCINLMQLVCTAKVNLSCPSADCNLGNHSRVKTLNHFVFAVHPHSTLESAILGN